MLAFNIQISKYLFSFTVLGILITGGSINSVNAIEQASSLSISIATTKNLEIITQQDNNLAEIRTVFDDNMRGLNTENLDLAMSTIDENSPGYQETRQLTQQIFDTYDLKYEINKFEILEISDHQATVRITQTTTKIQGPAFKDNVLVAKNTLKKSNGRWKIVSTELESINYLN